MPDKNKTVVRIAGREYTLVSGDTDEQMQKVALFVNRKMAETYKANPKLSTMMIAVLSALNVADECLKLKEKIQALEADLCEAKADHGRLTAEHQNLQSRLEECRKEEEQIRLDLTRKEAEIDTIRNEVIQGRK